MLEQEPLSEHDQSLLESVRSVLSLEAKGIAAMEESVGPSFCQALNLMAKTRGKVVLTGVGKSGLIARKISATLSSTGTVSTFLHPSDGMHGDLGVVAQDDVVIAIGKSGESEELVKLIPALKRLKAPIIAVTSNPDSRLAQAADVVLLTPNIPEACPLDLAPTTSTTMALAVGDALAITLMKMKEFKPEDFALYHPGGTLGRRLLLQVKDLMIPLSKSPILSLATSGIQDVIFALTEFGMGIVLFCSAEGELEAILTDGDIRRLVALHREKLFDTAIVDLVNKTPLTLSSDTKAVDALRFMEQRERPLNVVPIVDSGKAVGVLRLHELVGV